MAKTTDRAQALAQTFYDTFTRQERNEPNEFGDKGFYSLPHSKPECQWMIDAVREAHGDIMPNDWVYDACHTIVGHMADTDSADWDDSVSEWADGGVDVYNADRARWLAANLHFGGIVDEAVQSMGHSDQGVYGDIGLGQFAMLESIAAALIKAVLDKAEEDEAEEGDDDGE